MSGNDLPEVLVLKGGGAKAFATPGAMYALEKFGYLENVKTVAGTSAGAMIAMFWCAGFSPDEIIDLFCEAEFEEFFDPVNVAKIFFGGCAADGEWLEQFLCETLKEKGHDPEITMKELYESCGKELVINAVRKRDGSTVIFDHRSFPSVPVVKAVLASCAIPTFLSPVEYGGEQYYDGGISFNYLVHLFDPEKVLGIYLGDHLPPEFPSACYKDRNMEKVYSTINTFMMPFMTLSWVVSVSCYELERKYLEGVSYREVRIDIDKNVETFSFNMSKPDRKMMATKGIECATAFLLDPEKKKVHVSRNSSQ